MLNEARWAFKGNSYDWLFFAFIIFGLIFLKGKRKLMIIPAILITLAIVNPVTYDFWYKINDRAYWRLIWAVPIIAICAVVPSFFIDKIENKWFKLGTMIIAVIIFMLCGSLVYDHGNTTFKETNNPDKLPEDVVRVARALLDLDDKPYVVADLSVAIYLRQYSGRIKTMYARNIAWGTSEDISKIYDQLTKGEYEAVALTMLNRDYKYLVTENKGNEQNLLDSGFHFIKQIDRYGIYSVSGKKNIINEYNENHQIVRTTNIDENGVPSNNQNGYTAKIYEYDNYDRLISEKTVDINDYLIKSNNGYAIKEYQYPDLFRKPLVYYYNEFGDMIENGSGYLHEYLKSLEEGNRIVFISVCDDASTNLMEIHEEDLKKLGIKTKLRGKWRQPLCVIISSDEVIEKTGENSVKLTGMIKGISYEVISTGGNMGIGSSIVIDGKEYAQNQRGLNIVVYDIDKKNVIDSIAFDTYEPETRAYR